MSSSANRLERAIDFLKAERDPQTRMWVYLDTAAGSYYASTTRELVELAKVLEISPYGGYDLWCAETECREVGGK